MNSTPIKAHIARKRSKRNILRKATMDINMSMRGQMKRTTTGDNTTFTDSLTKEKNTMTTTTGDNTTFTDSLTKERNTMTTTTGDNTTLADSLTKERNTMTTTTQGKASFITSHIRERCMKMQDMTMEAMEAQHHRILESKIYTAQTENDAT
jgi:hypothetical protein